MKKLFIKIKSWEYWPIGLVYLPVAFVWLFYAFRLRNVFFFTPVNPNIKMAGFAGESKMSILNQIPKQYIPNSFLVQIKEKLSFNELLNSLKVNEIDFPCIAKPDVGERGLGVSVCKEISDLKNYLESAKTDFIVQNYISFPEEYAVLYFKLPGEKMGKISSLCQKEFLSIKGDGLSTISHLMKENERAFLQLERFEKDNELDLNAVLKKDEKLVLEPIGNHCRGTTFLNKNHLIDKSLEEAIHKLSQQIEGLNYGRYDLKCESLEHLKNLEAFSIMEINGVSAEPAHIYQPGFSFLEAQKVLLQHWNVLYKISKNQIQNGVKSMSFSSAISHIKKYRKTIALQTKQ